MKTIKLSEKEISLILGALSIAKFEGRGLDGFEEVEKSILELQKKLQTAWRRITLA